MMFSLQSPNPIAPANAGNPSCGKLAVLDPAWLRSSLGLATRVKLRWIACFVGLVALMAIVAQVRSHNAPKAIVPRIVVLAQWSTNGKQFVTFRPDPSTALITYAGLVSAATDDKTQPPTTRGSDGLLFPLRNAWETNYSLRFVASPMRTLPVPGEPLVAYTPGSCTVAYTPTDSGERVRVGLGLEQGITEDYIQRLRNCWERKRLALLWRQSYQDTYFVATEPLTNAVQPRR